MTNSAARPKIVPAAPKRLRAALYGRVSLDQHGTSPSPGRQQSVGEVHCERNDWESAGAYSDGESASRHAKKTRSDWARLLDDIRAGRIDVVIVWEWSRADRNLTTGSAFLDLCRDHDVLIHVASKRAGRGKTYDVRNDPDDWAELARGLVDNAMEVELLRIRSTDARRDRVEKGIVDGKIAYGYVREYDPHTRRFLRQSIHPQHGKIVREIVQRVAAGEALSSIADSLTLRGVPTPKGGAKWYRSVVRTIAMNPAYISRRSVNDKLWPVDWPAIVSEAEHFAAVRLLSEPSRKTTKPGRAVWLLSFIARCAECDGPLAARKRGNNDDGTPRRMYECDNNQCAAILVRILDDAVTVALCRYLALPDVYKALTRVDDAASEAIAGELLALENKLAFWRAQAGTGIDDESIGAALRNVNASIDDVKARRDALNKASGAVRVLLGDRQHSFDELRARFADDDLVSMAQRREIVRELLDVKLTRYKRAPAPGRVARPDRERGAQRFTIESRRR